MSFHSQSLIWSIVLFLSLGNLPTDKYHKDSIHQIDELEQYKVLFSDFQPYKIKIDSIDLNSHNWTMPIKGVDQEMFNMPLIDPYEK